MSDDTPTRPHATSDPVQAETLRLLRHMSRRIDEMSDSMGSIKSRLDVGDAHLDRMHDIPDRMTRIEGTVDTLRLVVYGAIGLALLAIVGKILSEVVP